MRVPDAVRTDVGKAEIKIFLKSSDYREVRRRGRIERVKIDVDWEPVVAGFRSWNAICPPSSRPM
ncbi:hypothetical protein [Mesorhizobium neociceri]|uniref:hypothetical protein n=1 Tax=Mesorhizobium neociceri TaxID=1307853 RepID=UPI0038B418D5